MTLTSKINSLSSSTKDLGIEKWAKIEHELETERSLLHSLIDSIPDLVFYKDIHGIYIGWNAAFEAFSKTVANRKPGEVSDADLYPKDLADLFVQTDQQVLSTGAPINYENWTMNSAGQMVLLETRKTPYFGPNGEILGVIGVVRDITKHRLAENALRQANLEIGQIITSLSSILIAINPDLTVTRWNPTAHKVFGIPIDEAIGKPLRSLNITLEWERISEGIQVCKTEHRTVYPDPVRFKRVGGGEGYAGFSISPIFTSDQSLGGYILLGADITERRILESRLAQAQKLESIGQLAAGVAHEINTPIQYIGDNTYFLKQCFADIIGVIQNYQDWLVSIKEKGVTPEDIQELETAIQQAEIGYLTSEVPAAIDQTLEGIHRVAEIIRALKGFSHPGIMKKSPLNLNKAIQDTLMVSRNEWKYVADVETDLDPNLTDVICLPGEINQVFLNIIVNAAQAISEVVGSHDDVKGKIKISTKEEHGWAEVRIADTGKGIPEEIRNRIFEPFFTTKDVGKGTGQGLAIAYDIIEVKHKGTLTFETVMGKGSTFIIRLPIEPDET